MTQSTSFRLSHVGTIAWSLSVFLCGAAAATGDDTAELLVSAVDANSRMQISGFQVSLVGKEFDKVSFETQKDGRQRCNSLPVGQDLMVVVSAEGYVPEFEVVALSNGAAKEISLNLKRAPFVAPTARDALKSLGKRYRKQEERYGAALRGAQTEEDRLAASRLSPRLLFIDELFAFEERWRGTMEGLAVLQCLAQNAAIRIDAKDPVYQAAERAGEILKTQYGSHPQLDSVLWMFCMTPNATAEPLLRTARRSADPQVRASGTYHLAVFLERWGSDVGSLSELRQDAMHRKDEEHIERLTAMLDHLAKIGFTHERVAERRQEALELCHELQEDSSIRRRQWTPYLDVVPFSDGHFGNQLTFADLAKRLEFAMVALAVGSTIPEIDAPDPDGQALRLSSFRGKVTVLLFSADWCPSCVAMYPQLRQLIEKHADDQFAVVSVMGDQTVDTVRKAIADKKIIWPVWWDGNEPGDISTRWSIKSWPAVFVIDHRGVIRYRDPPNARLNDAVDDLVQAAKADK